MEAADKGKAGLWLRAGEIFSWGPAASCPAPPRGVSMFIGAPPPPTVNATCAD